MKTNTTASPEPTLSSEAVRSLVQSHLNLKSSEGQLYRVLSASIEVPALDEVMKAFDWNQSHAAEYLGINRATLKKKLDRYGIKRLPENTITSIKG